jgi:hypothetical protein
VIEALSSNPSTIKKEGKRRERKKLAKVYY